MRREGIHFDLSNEDYHSDVSAIGASGLKAMLEAPAYYHGNYLDPDCPPESDRETPGRRFGSMMHCQLFEHHLFNDRYRVGPAVHSKALKAWKDFAATLPDGCDGITPAEYKAMQQVRKSVLSIPDMAKALAQGHGEVSAYAVDPETGVRCKVRPDWVHDVGSDSVILLDGKSYQSADADEFSRQAARMRYFLQAALYTDIYQLASGKRVLGFVFLLVADSYPHLANAVMLDEASVEAGRRLYRQALSTYAECQRTGIWPGHGHDVKIVSLPKYALEA